MNTTKKFLKMYACALCAGFMILASGARPAGALDFNGDWLGEKPGWAPDVSVKSAFLTKYIWRGQNLGDAPVMQNDYSLSKYGLTFDLWTNYSFNNDKSKDAGRYEEFTEVDYALDYTFNAAKTYERLGGTGAEFLAPVNFSFGYTYYTFPILPRDNKYADSHEVYSGCSLDVLLKPFVKWYWDVDSGKGAAGYGSGDGSYFLAGIGHSFDLGSNVALNLGMTAAYNDQQWTQNRGWSDMVFSGDITVPVLKYFTIKPNVSYSLLLDRDVYNHTQSNEFYGGVTIGFAY
ncbi:MAG: hypothetical protein HQL28_01125 [Candidatus Omnitrophica bacterium]|nr:hypothetical protein [Candidatus Omnitrophota bacterium]